MRTVRAILAVQYAVALMGFLTTFTLAASEVDSTSRHAGTLQRHQTVERQLGPGESDEFAVKLRAGQFLHLTVEQLNLDVTLSILDPSGKKLATMDSPNAGFGPEPMSLIANISGLYRLRVTAATSGASSGKYRIQVQQQRPPTESDRSRITAERVLVQAVTDQLSGTAEGRKRALDEYASANKIWNELGDRYEEGLGVEQQGELYFALGQRQEALDCYRRALPLRRLAKDRFGEAVTLTSLGEVYSTLGDKPKALDFFSQALLLRQATADRGGEAATLNNIGAVYDDLGDKKKAVDYYNRALSIAQSAHDRATEAATLSNIGYIESALGEQQKALHHFNQALAIDREIKDRTGEAATLHNIAAFYDDTGEKQKALDFYGQALAIKRETGDRAGAASTLLNMATIYNNMGQKQKALDQFEQVLSLFRSVGNRAGEAATLLNLSYVQFDLGERQKTLDYISQALPIFRSVRNRLGEAMALNEMGRVYYGWGEEQKALVYYDQVLSLLRSLGDRSAEAMTLANIGKTYLVLGNPARALEYFTRAQPIQHDIQDRMREAATLSSMGLAYFELKQYAKALDYYGQVLATMRQLNAPSGEAEALDNLGKIYRASGQSQSALGYLNQALSIRHAIGERATEAMTLNDIGGVYTDLGDKQQAWDYFNRALPIERSVGARVAEANTLDSLRSLLESTTPELAVLFGKQAVNVLQNIRRDNRNLDVVVRKNYESSIASAYRDLASLLVTLSRFSEAEEVLNLLKDKEAVDYIQRDSVSDQLRSVTLLESEKVALAHYDQIVDQIVKLGQRKASLLAKRQHGGLSQEELAEAQKLDPDLEGSNVVLNRFLAEEQRAFAPNTALARQVTELRSAESVQPVLQMLGSGTVAIYTLMAEDRYIALLITPGARKAYLSKIKQDDLNHKLFAFRQTLQNPTLNPVPQAQELYHILFPEHLRDDLNAIHARNILWSLDGTLRYVPINALHDGTGYLVESFRNSLITPESLASLAEGNSGGLEGAGFGVSAVPGFPELPKVPEELHGIFRVTSNDHAPVSGPIWLNSAFTKASFKQQLSGRVNPIVHIATHFDARPGVAANSNMLLGDGTMLNLAEIEAGTRLFDGVDLLTLSACSTAFQIGRADGREVDGLGTIAQRLGARSVIASLWSVNDEATAVLMETLYENWKQHPELGKGEALRRAQARMAAGSLRPIHSESVNALAQKDKVIVNNWTHPFYWAPFILIGNGN